MKKTLFRTISALLTVAVLAFTAATARATNGSWNVDADGNWSTAANWLNNIIATDPSSTAYFTNAITSVHTVTLDSARTNGNLVFDNANGAINSGGWILSGSGLTLTNSAATPVITVSNVNELFLGLDATNDVIINSVITSPQGFIKNGPGTVTLNGANVLGASAQLNEGIVAIGNASALGSGNRPVNFSGGGVRVWLGGPTYANTNNVLTTCTVISSNGNYDAINGIWNGSGTILIHANARLTPGNGNNAAFANFTGTIDLSDSPANEIRMNLGSGSTPYNLAAVTLNAGTNAGRFDFRATAAPASVRIGALLGGPNTRLDSSEQGTGTSLFWEIGYLNTSTLFEGTIRNRNGAADRVGHLVKVGTGKLTLTGNSTYTGNTIISNGVLALSNSAALSSTPIITVYSPGRFDVSGLTTPFGLSANRTLGGNGVVTGSVATVNGTIAPGTASIGTLSFSNSLSMDGSSLQTTNLFKLGSGVNDQLVVAGDLTLSGTIALRVVPTGAIIPNGSYVLYKWAGTLTGDTNNFAIEYPGQPGTFLLSTNLAAKQIVLQVSGVPSANNLVWKGDGAANAWDLTTLNWLNSGSPSLFNNGDKVTFDNTGNNTTPVDISASVNPAAVLVNATQPYVIGSTAAAGIIGSGGLVKSNTGVLTISSDNTYSGGTLIAGGILQVGDNANSSGSLGSGVITNNAILVFNRPDVITVSPIISGSGAVVQQGFGTLTLNNSDSYAGGTTISNGIVRVPAYLGLGSGAVTLAGGTLEIVPSGSATVGLSNNLNVVGSSVLQYDASGTFAAVVFGALTGNSGVTLTVNHTGPGNPDRLRLYGSFTNNANLDLASAQISLAPYSSSGDQAYNGIISGAGAVVQRGSTTTYLNAQNTYSGGTTNTNGRLAFGANSTSSAGTVISGPLGTGPLVMGNETPGSGGNSGVLANGGSRTIENPILYPNTNAFTFIIAGSNDLTLAGTLTLSGTDGNGFALRTIQVDNTAISTFAGVIDDAGLASGIIKTGAGSLTLSAVNTYTGATVISNGTLLVNGQIDTGGVTVAGGALSGTGTILGPVTVQSGGTLAPGASIGTLTINNNLTLGGNTLIEVNKSVNPSNDLTIVSGTLNSTGGTLTVSNLGPALVVGDQFKVFNKAVQNGGTITVTGAGATWANNLATDGSITVNSLIVGQPTLNFAQVGNSLQFTWSGSFKLQSQTNSINVGLSSNWGDYPGGGVSGVTVPIDATKGTVFFRLVSP
jgi:fibronectin-binding autotransporter adhesin